MARHCTQGRLRRRGTRSPGGGGNGAIGRSGIIGAVKLLLLSDLHLEVAPLTLPTALDFDVAVLAGDIANPGHEVPAWVCRQPALRRAQAVVWVPGNHEYYDQHIAVQADRMRAPAAAADGPPVVLLDGASRVIGGVRFIGCTLWTDFELRIDTADGPRSDPAAGWAAAQRSVVDYRVIDIDDPSTRQPRKLQPSDTLALHRHQRAWLAQALAEPFDGATVVVTHHGPHRRSLAPSFAGDWLSAAFISELPERFFGVPALWVHGHTHTSFDYRIGGCRVVCNPRGYQHRSTGRPENPAFDAALVVELKPC